VLELGLHAGIFQIITFFPIFNSPFFSRYFNLLCVEKFNQLSLSLSLSIYIYIYMLQFLQVPLSLSLSLSMYDRHFSYSHSLLHVSNINMLRLKIKM